MKIQHRHIPVLPERPRTHPIEGQIIRSYPVGRENFSRSYQGKVLELTITSNVPFSPDAQANLLTNMDSKDGEKWSDVPFSRKDERTFMCQFVPKHTGLFSFLPEFSLNKGATWVRDNVPDAWILVDPPQVDGLTLYTFIPTVSGTLEDWKDDLKRIKEMGFTAIHLLPITTLDTSESPYSAHDLFDVDHSYLMKGSKLDNLSQLEEYIEEAKALNIRLCFDLVMNHVGVNSLMAKRTPDWIVEDVNQPDGLQRAKYWDDKEWRFWEDLVLINYEHPSEEIRSEIWAYMTDYVLFWAKYANDTGGFIRFDNLHSSDPNFVGSMTKALHSEYPQIGVLAEYFVEDSTLLRTGPKWDLSLNLATPWNCKFAPQLREYLQYIHRVSKQIRYFMPITSHDCGSPAQEFGTADSTVPRYVAAALLGTGATGMPQGVEFGESERIDFVCRKPKVQYPAVSRFGLFIGKVNDILARHTAFQCGENCQFVDGSHDAIIAAFRKEKGEDTIGFLVICNFDTHKNQYISFDLEAIFGTKAPYSCIELLSDKSSHFENGKIQLNLPPCNAQVLRFF